jgi:nucleosome binding factor SPN SPT16 subunit
MCRHVSLNFPKDQESVYNLLLNLQAEILQRMKDGSVARDLYQHALSYVKKHRPDLEKNFVKNIGFGVSYATPVHWLTLINRQ